MLGTGRVGFQQIDHLGGKPQLRDRKRSELNLETDYPCESRADRRGNGALCLIRGYAIRDALEDAERKGPGPHRRVGGLTSGDANPSATPKRRSSRSASSTIRTIAVTISGGV
jgi:hypothetical protein